MILQQLELTTALRPSLQTEEALLFVQDGVGLYRDKYKIENHQNGHAYLTSHRICYVDNDDPRQRSVAIELKDVDHPELAVPYGGLLKSSPKITIYPKPPKRQSLAVRPAASAYNGHTRSSSTSSPTRPGFAAANTSPAPPQQDINATWVCPICSFSNPVPPKFDPSTANANTPLTACQACGIKPPLVVVSKAAIAALANRPANFGRDESSSPMSRTPSTGAAGGPASMSMPTGAPTSASYTECPRCTFRNHPSISTCEICGTSLSALRDRRLYQVLQPPPRPESPAPSTSVSNTQMSDLEVLKLSFRAGGHQAFHDRLKEALIQRKWLLASAPPPPRPDHLSPSPLISSPSTPPQRRIGIAGLERRDIAIRKENELVMGNAFSDLEALMTSAKEVIAMAERFASSQPGSADSDASKLLSESASALGLVTTRDMLGGGAGAERTYTTQLSRDLAEYLTDDRTGVLKREGGVMTLVDLWAVFNRRRNGIELVSPTEFEAAAGLWEELKLPIRLRRFRSGVLVVQGRDRSDEKTVRSLQAWLNTLREAGPPPKGDAASLAHLVDSATMATETGLSIGSGDGSSSAALDVGYDWYVYGRGVTAQEAAERFGWSLGVATEELEMAEERGALVREQDASGVKFWENHFDSIEVDIPVPATPDHIREDREVMEAMREAGLM